MKIYINKTHVKTIPERYRDISNKALANCFYHKGKRLTTIERLKLESELIKVNLDKLTLEIIQDKRFEGIAFVNLRGGDAQYFAMFGNMLVACTNGRKMYELQGIDNVQYRNV